MSLPETRIFDDPDTLAPALADALEAAAVVAIAARGAFHLVLAGGTTPRALYHELARRGAGDVRWHVWYGDERCLREDDPERNSFMAETAWLAGSAIPLSQRAPIPTEQGAEAAAACYASWLARVPDFDLVLLGVGEDGHTASLFPGQNWRGADVLAVHHAPKPPPDRVSLSANRLSRSRNVWFVATGAGKHDALARWRRGMALPVSVIHGRLSTLRWLDQAASGF